MHQLANDNLDTSPSWFDFPSRYTKQAVVTGPWTIKSASCIFRNRWHKHVPQKRKVSYENLFFESITVEEYVLGSIFLVWWNWLELVQNIQLFRDLESLPKKNLALSFWKTSGPRSPYELAHLRTVVHLSAPLPTVLQETWNEMGKSRVLLHQVVGVKLGLGCEG